MLKEMVEFFILELLKMLPAEKVNLKSLVYLNIKGCWIEFQFSVLGNDFSVLVPEPENFNSLYRVSDYR